MTIQHPRRAVAAAVACLAFVSACGSGGDGNPSEGKVAFLMPDTASTRYELRDRPDFEKRLKQLCAGCTPLYNNADGSADKQAQQFNSALAQGAKVIVIDPVDSAAAASLVNAAHSRDVKVIAYDRPIPDVTVDFYISFDNEKLGRELAASLTDRVKADDPPAGSGLLIVNGSPTDAAAGLIKKGIQSAVDASGLRVLAAYDTIDWKPENAQKWVSGQISRFGSKIIGVVAANDGTAGGTIAAFKAAGVSPQPPVSGNDATLAGLQLIIAGDQYNTISKPSTVVGHAAAAAAVDFLNGKTPTPDGQLFGSPSQLYAPTLVTADNLQSTIIDQNANTVEQLCTREYAARCRTLGLTKANSQ